MAWRINDDQLRQIVETDVNLDTAIFIRTANALTNQLAKVDSTPGGVGGVGGMSLLGPDLLTEIELQLAAHFYSLRDQKYSSKSTGGASGSFQGNVGEGLAGDIHGCNALALDITGWLARINRGVQQVQLQAGCTLESS